MNHAFYKLAKRAKQFYMRGPSIHELPDRFGPNYRCLFIRTDFSTVASDSHLVPEGKDDISRLKASVPPLEGPKAGSGVCHFEKRWDQDHPGHTACLFVVRTGTSIDFSTIKAIDVAAGKAT